MVWLRTKDNTYIYFERPVNMTDTTKTQLNKRIILGVPCDILKGKLWDVDFKFNDVIETDDPSIAQQFGLKCVH